MNQIGSDPVALPCTLGWARDRRDSALLPTERDAPAAVRRRSTLPGRPQVLQARLRRLSWYFPLTRDVITCVCADARLGRRLWRQAAAVLQELLRRRHRLRARLRAGHARPAGPERRARRQPERARQRRGARSRCPGMGQDKSLRLGAFVDAGQVWLARRPRLGTRTVTRRPVQTLRLLAYGHRGDLAGTRRSGRCKLLVRLAAQRRSPATDAAVPVHLRAAVLSASDCAHREIDSKIVQLQSPR